MNAKIKSLLSSLLGSSASPAKKSGVKPAVSRQQKERSELIDLLVASAGNDLKVRARLFQIS